MQEPIPGAAPNAAALTFGPLGRQLFNASKVSAIVGGLMFVAIVIMSIISIVGRKLWSAPVPGDVEMLQMAAAFASASFFAYCHLNGGDVKVDFFTARASAVGVFGALITWRAGVGALAIRTAGETSMILGWPVWVAQILMVPGFLLLALAGFYMVGIHLRLSMQQSGEKA